MASAIDSKQEVEQSVPRSIRFKREWQEADLSLLPHSKPVNSVKDDFYSSPRLETKKKESFRIEKAKTEPTETPINKEWVMDNKSKVF
jgi:hypothetical protein